MTNENFKSVGVKEHPLLLMKPACRIIMSLLHMLLGLINKIRKNLFDYACERIETLHADETQAINNVILDELEADELTLKFDLAGAKHQEHKTNTI